MFEDATVKNFAICRSVTASRVPVVQKVKLPRSRERNVIEVVGMKET